MILLIILTSSVLLLLLLLCHFEKIKIFVKDSQAVNINPLSPSVALT